MSAFTPPRMCRPRHFDIRRDRCGHWIARASDGLSGAMFPTLRAALRFALFEAGGHAAFVHDTATPVGAVATPYDNPSTFREMLR